MKTKSPGMKAALALRDSGWIHQLSNGELRRLAEIIDEETNATALLAACRKWLAHYDGCIRQPQLGDEPGIAEMRKEVAAAEDKP